MSIENSIKIFVAVVGLASFVFGVVKFVQIQSVEAERPYLEKKLAWCIDAVNSTSKIATATEPAQEDIDNFWQMYWGVMGLIEKKAITDAMVDFGNGLNDGVSTGTLKHKSLALAHACRNELSAEWSSSWWP